VEHLLEGCGGSTGGLWGRGRTGGEYWRGVLEGRGERRGLLEEWRGIEKWGHGGSGIWGMWRSGV
jgi:hypothetical protein